MQVSECTKNIAAQYSDKEFVSEDSQILDLSLVHLKRCIVNTLPLFCEYLSNTVILSPMFQEMDSGPMMPDTMPMVR